MDVSFCKRANNYRALLRKITYKDVWYNDYTMHYVQWLKFRCSIESIVCANCSIQHILSRLAAQFIVYKAYRVCIRASLSLIDYSVANMHRMP